MGSPQSLESGDNHTTKCAQAPRWEAGAHPTKIVTASRDLATSGPSFFSIIYIGRGTKKKKFNDQHH